ncbi:hypothetical protein [Umezawaea sp. Da 62-37]|uniref:hypothetical protein n=1 Tax=Umezawaea sp. Da 62-37 TaxID=3075927 RepID=UPI0028F749C4|nr:hypothetical protein [Umezawaea sp. Da 62-37]WNV88130.1 hypothetical protein RM788_07520 [Umezawaea sp. Da 62-37]
MASRTGLPVGVFPDLRLGPRLTWRGAEAVLKACMVAEDEIAWWHRLLMANHPSSPARHRRSPGVHLDAPHAVVRHTCASTTPGRRGATRREGPITMSHTSDALSRARAAATEADYVLAMDGLRLLSGRSFKQISELAGTSRLPKSTVHYMCRKKTLPTRREQVVLFVVGCGQSLEQAERWAVEWDRLAAVTRAPKAAPGEITEPMDPVGDVEADSAEPPAPVESSGLAPDQVEPDVVPAFPAQSVRQDPSSMSRILVAALMAQMLLFLVALYILH